MPHFDLLFPSKYFKSGPLQGEPDVVMTISAVIPKQEIVMAGGKKDIRPLMTFKETDRRPDDGSDGAKFLILNKTKCRVIGALYGGPTEGWPGNKISLYYIQDTGNGKPGIGVRNQRPPNQTQQQSQPASPPQQPSAQEEEPPPPDDEPPSDPQTGEVFDTPEDATYQEIFDALEACNDLEVLADVWSEQEQAIGSLPGVMRARLRVVFSSRSSVIENRNV